ncbi:kinase-like domain-containing protein [Phycomyces nitens]|nr:kinase-like domain-containing protein [Phycomyces nitens]
MNPLGRGSSATVYSGYHISTRASIAIKRVDLECLDINGTGTRLDALHKEIQIMSLCSHPHLLPVYQSFVSNSHLYIVMPLMSAGSCLDLLQTTGNGLGESIVACILKQVALGLAYLHTNHLVHRDVKAANLLLDWKTGYVSLADFGVSNHLLANGAHSSEPAFDAPGGVRRSTCRPADLNPKASLRRSFVGTPCWMAPEILYCQAYGTAVDMWSFGITALELACGRAPFSEYDIRTVSQGLLSVQTGS